MGNLSQQNRACIETGKSFVFSNGYIKNDFDVQKWVAPKSLEQAAKALINARWAKGIGDKLPVASSMRLG